MGKAKPAKHTAKEISQKIAEATTNKGGGKDGHVDRLGGKAGHAKFQCHICMQQAPDLKSMQVRQAGSQTLQLSRSGSRRPRHLRRRSRAVRTANHQGCGVVWHVLGAWARSALRVWK